MIQIITDSLSDIRQSRAQQYALTVLPMHVLFGDKSYLDGINLSLEEFYHLLATSKDFPKTSQVSPEAFFGAFEAAVQKGDEVLCITGSSKLSGTYQSALIAKDMLPEDAPITILDSLNASLGQQILLWEAVRLRDDGKTLAEMAAFLTPLIPRISLAGQVDDLKHLVMGGRLSATTAKIGATLRLKPMLRLKQGKLEQDGLTRGKKRAFEWLAKQVETEGLDPHYPLALASANAPQDVGELHQYLMEKGLASENSLQVEIGPVIGSHTGQGILAIAWVRK